MTADDVLVLIEKRRQRTGREWCFRGCHIREWDPDPHRCGLVCPVIAGYEEVAVGDDVYEAGEWHEAAKKMSLDWDDAVALVDAADGKRTSVPLIAELRRKLMIACGLQECEQKPSDWVI